MRILLCTGIFPPEAGGPATYTKELAEALSERGHEVAVITYSDNAPQPPLKLRGGEGELRVIRIPRSWFKPLHYWRYFQAVKKHGRGADLLYGQDPVSAGYPTFLAARVLKKPYVVKITGDYSWEQAMGRGKTSSLIDQFQNEKHYGLINLMRRIQIHVCREAKLVVTPSEYLKRLVIGWSVKEKKICVIRNAAPEVKDLNREKHDGFRVVSVGRDVPWKGFAVLRQAIAELQSQIPELTLKILHKEKREDVLKNLAAADVFVLNSAYEGASHVTLEAMALGTPVVITNIGGNPEIVQHRASGLLFEYNNKEQLKAAIKELYHDQELRGQVAASAKAGMQKFSVDSMIRKTEAVLASVAGVD